MSPICLLALSLKLTSVRDLLPSSPPKLFLSSSLTNFVLLNTTGSFHYLYFLVFQQHLTEMFIPSLKFFLPITSRTPHSGGFLLYQAASLLLYFVSSESMNPNFGGSKAQHLDLCCFLASFIHLVILFDLLIMCVHTLTRPKFISEFGPILYFLMPF